MRKVCLKVVDNAMGGGYLKQSFYDRVELCANSIALSNLKICLSNEITSSAAQISCGVLVYHLPSVSSLDGLAFEKRKFQTDE